MPHLEKSGTLIYDAPSKTEQLRQINPLKPMHAKTQCETHEKGEKMKPGFAGAAFKAPLDTPSELSNDARKDIAAALTILLADVFALYMKTKNFHWHMSGPHFRDYHLLLDEHGSQIRDMTDIIAERTRKLGGITLHSVGQIGRLQRILDNDAEFVAPDDMLAELKEDNLMLAAAMREVHSICDAANDVATTSLLENWIDETERRVWFLFETTIRSIPKS